MSDSISFPNAIETAPLNESTTESQQTPSTTSSQQTSNSPLTTIEHSSSDTQATSSSDGVEESEEAEDQDDLALDYAAIAASMLMKSLSQMTGEAKQKIGSVAEAERTFAQGDENDENQQMEFNPFTGNFGLNSIPAVGDQNWPFNPLEQTQLTTENQPVLI